MPKTRSTTAKSRRTDNTPSATLDKFIISEPRKRKHSALTPESTTSDGNQTMQSRKQYEIQNCWTVDENIDRPLRTLVSSTKQPQTSPPCHEAMRHAGAKQYRFSNLFIGTDTGTKSPLPNLNWADKEQVWQVLRKKDRMYSRDINMLKRHPALQTRMRSVLLDWLSEVCEVYRLHRETFHLAIDFFDRYLASQINIQKHSLQLIGVTALFIASKIEEIYPPKVSEFAYVTDGACMDTDIMKQEIIMLKTLKWDLSPITANMWMTIYLQILNNSQHDKEISLTETCFSSHSFIQIAKLIDLCQLDIGCLQFSYSVLAASVLYHFSNEQSMNKACGLCWHDIACCVSWMAPFAIEVRESRAVHLRPYDGVEQSDYCNIQTHSVDLEMLESAQRRQQIILESSKESPKQLQQFIPDNILTPPPTTHKSSQDIDPSSLWEFDLC